MAIFAVAVSCQVYEIILGYSEGANQVRGTIYQFILYSVANADIIAILCLALQSNFSIQSDFSLQTIPDTKILSFPASYFKLGAQNILKRS